MKRELKIELKSSLFDPHSSDQRVLVRRTPSRPLYRVFLYLDGQDLPFVDSVTYYLHPTFNDPVRTVARTPSNPICKLEIWTWGIFAIEATIKDKTGARHQLSHYLTYDREIAQGEITFVPAS